MNALEAVLCGLPIWSWLVIFGVTIGLLVLAVTMIGIRIWSSTGPNLLRLAYRRPRLLRVSQSPCWTGALLTALGMLFFERGVLLPSAEARVLCVAHEALKARDRGELSPALQGALRATEAPWVALWEPSGSGTAMGSWGPDPKATLRSNASRAARVVGRGRVLEVMGATLFLLGGIYLLVML